jgi:hypothetical protein
MVAVRCGGDKAIAYCPFPLAYWNAISR